VKILAQLCSGDSLREHGSCWTEVASFYGVGNHPDRVISVPSITARQNTTTQQEAVPRFGGIELGKQSGNKGGQWLEA
jgi:hypothetical protein